MSETITNENLIAGTETDFDNGVIPLDAVDSPISLDVPNEQNTSVDAKLQGLVAAEEKSAQEATEKAELDAALGEQGLRDMTTTEGVAEDFITETQSLVDKQIDPQTKRDIEQLKIMIAQDDAEKTKLNEAIREGRGVQSSIARGQVARERAILGINIATNTAIKAAKEGQVEDAKAMAILGMQAKQAAEANALANERTFLQRSYDQLDSSRQKQADLRMKKIEKEEGDLTAIQDIYANAVLNGASKSTLDKISNAKSKNDAVKAAGTLALSPGEKMDLALKGLQYKTAKEAADARKLALENGEVVLTEDQQKNAFKLIENFEKGSIEFVKQTDAYNRVVASSEEPSAAGDFALIFNYMKVLDPGSTVREGEFQSAAEAGSYLDRIYGFGLKMKEGQRLSPAQRADFVERSTKLYAAAEGQHTLFEDQVKERSATFGVPSDVVIRDVRSTNFGENAPTPVPGETRGETSYIEKAASIINGSSSEYGDLLPPKI